MYEECLNQWSGYGIYKRLCKHPTMVRKITMRRALSWLQYVWEIKTESPSRVRKMRKKKMRKTLPWKHIARYDPNNSTIFVSVVRDLTRVEKLGLLACNKGDLVLLLWAIKRGYDPRVFVRHVCETVSAMTFAGHNGHINILKYLLHLGCVPSRDNHGALIYACDGDHIRTVRFLIRNKISEPCAANGYAFIKAANRGHLKSIKYLVRHGFSLHDYSTNGSTIGNHALFYAISNNYLPIVKYFIKHGCQPDMNNIRRNVKYFLSRSNNIIDYLVEIGYPDPRI